MRELDRKSVTHVTSALPVMLSEAELPLAEAQRVEASPSPYQSCMVPSNLRLIGR